jgi:molybdate transport system ATP-binding protein
MEAVDEFMIYAKGITVTRAAQKKLDDISFAIRPGDHLAIIGPSGSGKSTLGLVLAGKMFYNGKLEFHSPGDRTTVWIEQQHHFKNLSNTSDFYHQQRFNSSDSDDAHTVIDLLGPGDDAMVVLKKMRIESLANKPVIQLSNGENKKLQLAKALLSDPTLIIMDQPFVGLDLETRDYLRQLMDELTTHGISLVLITSHFEIPACITHVLELDQGRMKGFYSLSDFEKLIPNIRLSDPAEARKRKEQLAGLKANAAYPDFDCAIKMMDIHVKYGDKKILDGISWDVKKGDRWLLSGPNGAGKSTLLSLVTADNPQAYANKIWLFDRRRGSGESIWDIKQKIGYVSPELHLFFDQGSTAFETVASGLFDTIGLFRQISDSQGAVVKNWMEIMDLLPLRQKRLYELSVGEQRRILLARALVKNPPLLILDEPCQGLDTENQATIYDFIDTVCEEDHKTLVLVTHYSQERPRCINKFIKLVEGKAILE